MEREREFEKVKEVLKKNIRKARYGIYFTRNIVGDSMANLLTGKTFKVDICRYWGYYEVFGCTDEEEKELKKYYKQIRNDEEDKR